jgi:hypothetical protein
MLLSLLILSIHAWAANAINLLEPYIRTSPTLETPWLPFGKIYRGATAHTSNIRWRRRFAACHRLPSVVPSGHFI